MAAASAADASVASCAHTESVDETDETEGHATAVATKPVLTVEQMKLLASAGICEITTAAKNAAEKPNVKTTAKCAIGGAAVGGGAGGCTGAVTGAAVGSLVGLPAAIFTFGLSIPFCAAAGTVVGAGAGATVGSTTGFVGGGTAGYVYARWRGVGAEGKSKAIESEASSSSEASSTLAQPEEEPGREADLEAKPEELSFGEAAKAQELSFEDTDIPASATADDQEGSDAPCTEDHVRSESELSDVSDEPNMTALPATRSVASSELAANKVLRIDLSTVRSKLRDVSEESVQEQLAELDCERSATELSIEEEVDEQLYAEREEARRVRRALAEMEANARRLAEEAAAELRVAEQLAAQRAVSQIVAEAAAEGEIAAVQRSEVATARVAAAIFEKEITVDAADTYDQAYVEAAVEWLEDVTGMVLTGGLFQSLRTGEILCQLINSIKVGMIIKIERPGISYNERVNINHFLKACRTLGVPEYAIFFVDDLYENKNMPCVIRCIHALGSTVQRTVPEFRGPHLGAADTSNWRESNRSTCLDVQAAGRLRSDSATFTPRSFTPRSSTPLMTPRSSLLTPRAYTTTAPI